MKTNVAACSSIGTYFYPQIGRIYHDMLSMYKACSQMISESVVRDGKHSVRRKNSALNVDFGRFGRDQNAQGSRNADDQKGNPEAHRYLRVESR